MYEYLERKFLNQFKLTLLKEQYTFCIMAQKVESFGKQKNLMRPVKIFIHETMWSNQNQAEIMLKLFLMAEPVFVAKNWDEFWFVMKC